MIEWTIADLLEKKGWTAYKLAAETGLTVPAAYRLAAGGRIQRIDADTLERLCRALNVTPNQLIAFKPPLR
jgi:DNA-binding Xre family transcriptional regulator